MTTTDAPVARRLALAISVASAAITIAVIVTAGTVLGWFGPASTPTPPETVAADAAVPLAQPLSPADVAPQPVEVVPPPIEEAVLVYADDDDDDNDDDDDREHHDDDDDDEHEHEREHHHEDD